MDEAGFDSAHTHGEHRYLGLKLATLGVVMMGLVACGGSTDIVGSIRAEQAPSPNTDTSLRLSEAPYHAFQGLLTVTGQRQVVVQADCVGHPPILVSAEVESGIAHTYRARVNNQNYLEGQARGSSPANRGIFSKGADGKYTQVFEVDIDFPNAATYQGANCSFTLGHADLEKVDLKKSKKISQAPNFSPLPVTAQVEFKQPVRKPERIRQKIV